MHWHGLDRNTFAKHTGRLRRSQLKGRYQLAQLTLGKWANIHTFGKKKPQHEHTQLVCTSTLGFFYSPPVQCSGLIKCYYCEGSSKANTSRKNASARAHTRGLSQKCSVLHLDQRSLREKMNFPGRAWFAKERLKRQEPCWIKGIQEVLWPLVHKSTSPRQEHEVDTHTSFRRAYRTYSAKLFPHHSIESWIFNHSNLPNYVRTWSDLRCLDECVSD